MTILTDWQNRATEHTNIHERIRKLVSRRLTAIEKAADSVDKHFNAVDGIVHPEVAFNYLLNMRIAINAEELELLTKILDKTTKNERLSTGLKYNDINEIAKAAHTLGYRLAPKKVIDSSDKTPISEDTVNAIRKALGVQILTK